MKGTICMGKIKRRQNAIDRLPSNIKETIDGMIKSNSTYGEIVNYIKDSGYKASISTVQRYAVNLVHSLQALQIANQNFKAINDEIENYKNTDCTWAILILLNSKLLERINSLPDEQLQNLDITQLVKSTIALTKAMAYKKKNDIQTKTLLENGADMLKSTVYQAMAEEEPELYREVKKFIDDHLKLL